MADGTSNTSEEARPLPTPEEFIRFLVDRAGDVNQAGHAARRLVQIYAATWATVEGVSPGRAKLAAETLFDEVTTPAAELLAESQR